MHEVRDGRITLSTGVVFKITNVPVFAFDKVKQKMEPERPKVPTVHIEAKDRDEPNPNDPDYIAAVTKFDTQLYEKLIDMAVTLGTEVDSVPEGFPRATDESWTTKLIKLGIDIPPVDDEHERYLAWMKLCAMPTSEDLSSVIVACSKSVGVTEEDVADASASFRDPKRRRADTKT